MRQVEIAIDRIFLFAGPSGTGKTVTAEVLSGVLDLPLYRIDLSRVLSKYIGDTEKKLNRMFDEAERANAILFFDEADALFGKRSDVKDSNDRYANLDTAYFWQRIEDYPGLVILASDSTKNIDRAFLRRFGRVIEFPMPDTEKREDPWDHKIQALRRQLKSRISGRRR